MNKLTRYIYNYKGSSSLLFLIFILLTIVLMSLGTFLGVVIVIILYGFSTVIALEHLNLLAPNVINALWILQTLSTTIPMLAAPVFFAYVIIKDPLEYLKTNFKFSWLLFPIVLCIMLISSPLIELLSNINQKMVLPDFLNPVQQWMHEKEDTAQKVTSTILQMKTIWNLLFNIIFIGLLTAVVEEFMFRGCIQTIFTRWTKNTHAAIWISAILFSAFHMEFFGFLPRMMLGALFGYLVAWSGSIWPAVWAHFINNGSAVIAAYLYQHKKISINPDNQHVFNYAGYLFSLIIVILLLWLYRNVALGRKQVQDI